MRRILPAAALLVAACSGGAGDAPEEGNAANATHQQADRPPPLTPQMNVADQMVDDAEWMAPRDNAGDPGDAPYGNLLDRPLVDAPDQK